MELKEYQTIINKTAVYPRIVDHFGVAYTYFGLLGEAGEVSVALSNYYYGKQTEDLAKKALKEVGDVYWYITAFCNELEIDIEEIIKTEDIDAPQVELEETMEDFDSHRLHLISLAEPIKKYYRDGKELDLDGIATTLTETSLFLAEIITLLGSDVSTVLKDNYTKLLRRRDTNTLHGDGSEREESR